MNPAEKRLSLIDFGILGIIFFGYFTVVSVLIYLRTDESQAISASSFSDAGNICSIIIELFLLTVAGLYLRWRRFDFSSLSFSVGRNTFPSVLLLILFAALAMDVCVYGSYWLSYGQNPFSYLSVWEEANNEVNLFGHITIWLLLFSLLNGFFEEVFFMGLTFAVNDRHRIYAITMSVILRFGFHLYLGLSAAIGTAFLGIVFILMRRRKVTSLVPFMIAHAFFDVFGTGLISWIYQIGF